MIDFEILQDRLTKAYPTLTPQLRRAAQYVLERPGEVATLSMRQVAANAKLPVSHFARLAQSIDLKTYNEMRKLFRDRVQAGEQMAYPERAKNLQHSSEALGRSAVFAEFRDAANRNVESVFRDMDAEKLSAIAASLAAKRRVYLVGMQASQPFMRYFHYIAGMASRSIVLVGRDGSSWADDLVDLNEEDAVVCLALRPCARITIQIAKLAKERGALVLGITDSRISPLAAFSEIVAIAPTRSPLFFESYLGAVIVIEILVGFYLIHSGEDAITRIKAIEQDRHVLGEYWEERDNS